MARVRLTPPRKKLVTREKYRGLVPCGTNSHLDTEYSNYLEEVHLATDPALRQALAASTDPRYRYLLKYLASPTAAKRPLVYWVKRATIDMHEMMEWVGKAHGARAFSLAQAAGPKINSHMSQDAESRRVACGRCDGFGYVATDPGLPADTPGYRMLRQDHETGKEIWVRDCPNGCDHGKLREPGDEFSREKLLEQTGAINRKGMGIQIINNLGGQAMPSAVARLDVMTIDVEPG